ncbi:MAG: DUF4864 domain-containing protein [Alphaproteobacteria bacterium]|nr:DUF4864 domain-containing protein [Alphaproteobacteria bacterium]
MKLAAALKAFLIVWILTPTAWAQPLWQGSDGERQAIRQTIESQVEAFRREDGRAAFSLASPAIQQQFQTPENFMRMVQAGYAPVYRPRQFELRRTLSVQGLILQEVFFVGSDLTTMLLLYNMERQSDGSWRINGVFQVQGKEEAT